MLHALSPKFNPGQLQNGDVDIFLYGMNETQARHPIERSAEHTTLFSASGIPSHPCAVHQPNSRPFTPLACRLAPRSLSSSSGWRARPAARETSIRSWLCARRTR